MPAYTTSLRLIQPTTGEYSGSWGTEVNDRLTAVVDKAVAGTAIITMTAANYTLTNANGVADEAKAMFLELQGTPGASYFVIVPTNSKLYFVTNNTGFAQRVSTSTTPSSGILVPNGASMALRCDGANVVAALNYFGSLTLGAALPIASGGTGSTSTTYCSLTTNVTGTLPVGNGGTGATTLTGVVKGNGTSAFSAGAVSLATEVTGILPVANGGTGNTTIPALSIFVANALNTLTSVTATAGQSIRVNAGGTAWETYTSAVGDAVLSANNAFTGANTFYNNTGQTFGTGTAAQDGVIIAGRAGGTNTRRVTLSPGTLTANRAVTFPDAAGELVVDTAVQTLTNKTLSSPTLTTPILGTPTSGVLTNCTGTAVGLTAGNLTQTTVGTAISITTAASSSATASGNISIATGLNSSHNSGDLNISTGAPGSSSGAVAGSIGITAGSASLGNLATGGSVTITAGNGSSTTTNSPGSGGNVTITAGTFSGLSTPANASHTGGKVTITGGSSNDTIGVPGAVEITAGSSTGGVAGADIKLTTGTGSSNGKINFVNCDVANGSVATAMSSVGPTGSSTTIQGWLAIKINGTARYIPFW